MRGKAAGLQKGNAHGSGVGPCLRVQWKGELNNAALETMDMS